MQTRCKVMSDTWGYSLNFTGKIWHTISTFHTQKQTKQQQNTYAGGTVPVPAVTSEPQKTWPIPLSHTANSKQQDVLFRGNAIYWNKETLLPSGRNELTITCSVCRKWPTYLDVKPGTQRPWCSASETRVKKRFWLSTRLGKWCGSENLGTRI